MKAEFVKSIVKNALAEDLGEAGDITSNAVIPADAVGKYAMEAREEMVFAGLMILESFDKLEIEVKIADGDKLAAGDVIAEISGNVREILRIERVALNFLQHLSGIATETAKYVSKLASDEVALLDTRKTTPGLRELEKYAVRCGGGKNHRMGLYDMVMIKDNHIEAAGGISAAIKAGKATGLRVEIECDTLKQVAEAASENPDVIMLDNFEIKNIEKAIDIVSGRAEIEVSGGVNLESIRRISKTGVNYISTSKITQGSKAVDIGLDEL